MESKYTPEQIERLWQYRDSEITFFNNFINAFVVAESVLLAVVGMFTSSGSSKVIIVIPVVILGLVLTLLWMYVQAKTRFILNSLKSVCADHLPEYREQLELRANSIWRLSTSWILAFLLPLLFATVWIFILFAVL